MREAVSLASKRGDIPPILHYCWFGPAPEPHRIFRERWAALHPDYKILRWNEGNAPITHPYLKKVLSCKAYSKASDFMRLWLMKNYGGIYLDVDIECLRSLEPLRPLGFFVGLQREASFDSEESVNSAVLGATKGHWAIEELFRRLIKRDDGSLSPMDSGPRLISQLLLEWGLCYSENKQVLASETGAPIHVMPRRSFYPFSWIESYDDQAILSDSFTLHHWDGSWVPAYEEQRKKKSASQFREGGGE